MELKDYFDTVDDIAITGLECNGFKIIGRKATLVTEKVYEMLEMTKSNPVDNFAGTVITGGNGSGKSSVIQAIIFGLFGKVPEHTLAELANYDKDSLMIVRLYVTFYNSTYGFMEIEIYRNYTESGKSSLDLSVSCISGNVPDEISLAFQNYFEDSISQRQDGEKFICDKILGGLTYKEFLSSCYFVHEDENLISATPKKRVEVLDNLFEMSWEECRTNFGKKIRHTNSSLDSILSYCEKLGEKRESILVDIKSLQESDANFKSKDDIRNLGVKVDNLEEKHRNALLKAGVEDNILLSYEKQLKELLNLRNSLIIKGVSAICPTCGNNYDKAHLDKEIKKQEKEVTKQELLLCTLVEKRDKLYEDYMDSYQIYSSANSVASRIAIYQEEVEKTDLEFMVEVERMEETEDDLAHLNYIYSLVDRDSPLRTKFMVDGIKALVSIANNFLSNDPHEKKLFIETSIIKEDNVVSGLEIYAVHDKKIKVSQLSRGEKKKIALAFSYATHDLLRKNDGKDKYLKILLMDEMLEGLDDPSSKFVVDLLVSRFKSEGRRFYLTTHSLDVNLFKTSGKNECLSSVALVDLDSENFEIVQAGGDINYD